jgi:lipid-A-disaccharide synthase
MKIMLSAGEASGDRLGAGLARALLRRAPGVTLFGMGGEEMEDAGVRLVAHASDVAVVGFVEVVRHLPEIRRAMDRLTGAIATERPDVVVPIDFPDFNLRLAGKASASGVPVVYYVSPQVWAWRRGRVATMRRILRRMLVVLPFEAAFYGAEGVPVTFVGHPAAAARPRASRDVLLPELGLSPDRPVVALLPGSRMGEAGRLFPILLASARRLSASQPDVQFVVPVARTLPAGFLSGMLAESGTTGVVLRSGDYPGILEVADAAAVASGTATLDAALAGVPFVAVYRMQMLSYAIARMLVRVPHIALPNLIAGRRVVPELVQGACTPEAIAAELARFLADPAAAGRLRAELAGVATSLQGEGAFDRAAEAILRELGGP